MKVAVIGGGVAGTVAAWTLRRAHVDVTMLHDLPGATALYSGALDLLPWETPGPTAPLPSEILAFAAAFDAWTLGTGPGRVATYEGVLRPARGADAELLDVGKLAGKRIAVADCVVEGWDGKALARRLASAAWAERTRTSFEPIRVPGFLDPQETRLGAYDVAALHDSEERLDRLANALGGADSGAEAWLLGPWLGTTPGASDRLSARVGKRCGETTSSPGGPAGARFDASRDALLSSVGVNVRVEHVDRVERRGSRWQVFGAAPGLTSRDSGFDAIVLATGGVAGGGIELDGASFRPSLEAPVTVGLDGRSFVPRASPQGVDFASLGLSALERVGIRATGSRVLGAERLLVAGDAVEGRPRTALEAALSAVQAARATPA